MVPSALCQSVSRAQGQMVLSEVLSADAAEACGQEVTRWIDALSLTATALFCVHVQFTILIANKFKSLVFPFFFFFFSKKTSIY